jgi:GNAT superfamily N-acetyltransferase
VSQDESRPRLATAEDASEIARLLHDFNSEYGSPSPGVEVLAPRLRALLAGDQTFAVIAGQPPAPSAVALVTLRPNVWYAGPVALLDEMYVVPSRRGRGIGSAVLEYFIAESQRRGVELLEINVDEGDVDAQRFYERHGFSGTEPETDERAFYFFREFGDSFTRPGAGGSPGP